jgi:lipoprotein-anchoring transpeptidase ErfK/SrfK
LRSSISLVVASCALAGTIGVANAQYYPPQPAPPDYSPPQPYTQAPLPPQPGVRPYGAQPYYGPSAAAPGGYYGQSPVVYRDASGMPYDPDGQAMGDGPVDSTYTPASRPYFAPNDHLPPQPLPAIGDTPFSRPPADIGEASAPDDTTGAVAGPRSGTNSRTVIASLPPEDQPEQGPGRELPPQFRKQLVSYATKEPTGTIVVDTPNTYLYFVLGNGKAMRYGIGVGREGFTWTGTERISRAKEWPDWFPPKEMIERQPYLPRFMAGGETNPLGARALYLGNTLYRIHGTNQPSTIGTFVSSGCIRLTNDDIADLYSRVGVGTRVVVLPGSLPASASTQGPIAR